MKRHGRRASLLLVIALVAAGALAASLVPSASAVSGPPTLTGAMNRRGDVRLEWRFTTNSSRTRLVLNIDRSASAASGWTKLISVNRPRPNAFRTDKNPMAGTSYYRARLFDNDVLVGTSAPVQIGGSGPTTAPPPPATTTTTRPPATTTTTRPPTTTTTTVPNGNGACAGVRAEILRIVNQDRAANGRSALVANAQLDAAAQVHTDKMAAAGRIFHDNWDTEIRQSGYPGGWLGQNVAAGYPTPAAVMKAWFDDEAATNGGHYQNILGTHYHDLGVGCVEVSTGYRYYWTQNFGG